ncbi:co-chaperone DjlA [Legionella fairfieldensis]|uniref:co-chaperone DjlA n=1 Tax=Legionella fairfieldensis TaxID=45064 RepID=UPI00048D683B|nr:co-chaperone DjlA [Legionella fairfieldensis]
MNFRQFFTTNRWWGKLLGAFFGFLIGGAAGAFFGILIGNFFDRGLMSHFNRPYWHYYNEKRKVVRKVFFEATFSVMGHIAKADGRISEQEIHIAKMLMEEMRLNQEEKKLAQHFFNKGKDPSFNLVGILTALQNVCQSNPELLKSFIDIQYRAVQTDALSERKIQALDRVLLQMGFAPLRQQDRFYEDFGYTNSHYSSSQSSSHQSDNQHSYSYNRSHQTSYQNSTLAQAYAILELNQNASKQEVKRAYRRLISRNHPDKLIAQGLPDEQIKRANDKTQKITKAYEQICASKGW